MGDGSSEHDEFAGVLLVSEEILYRQIHPIMFQKERLTSSAFLPRKTDKGLLSLSRSSMISAQRAFELHLESRSESMGVVGAMVSEFTACNIRTYHDPVPATLRQPENRAHANADMRDLGPSRCQKVSKKLSKVAWGRGWLYQP